MILNLRDNYFKKYKNKIDKGSGKGKNKCGRRSTRENISLLDLIFVEC
jgi:hypothetical protein